MELKSPLIVHHPHIPATSPSHSMMSQNLSLNLDLSQLQVLQVEQVHWGHCKQE